MNDGEFQWDDRKAASNVVDHNVRFDAARLVFEDPFGLDWLGESEDCGADRYCIVGMSESRLLFFAHTMRGAAIRIISARLAELQDRRGFHDENDI